MIRVGIRNTAPSYLKEQVGLEKWDNFSLFKIFLWLFSFKPDPVYLGRSSPNPVFLSSSAPKWTGSVIASLIVFTMCWEKSKGRALRKVENRYVTTLSGSVP
jgi:hypothetical protein